MPFLNDECIQDEIVSIEFMGYEETYDLSVEEDHSFLANGLVVHNTSAKDPAVQTIPKHTPWAKKLRRGYISPPGFVMVNWDYAQGELKIAACIADEPTMIQAYMDGLDLHMITGGRINGYDVEDMLGMMEEAKTDKATEKLFKSIRQGGKAGNFGLLYGMGANGFREYARTTYGVTLTSEEAENARDSFFELYTKLPDWHTTSKTIAARDGQIASPLGRVRHLPLINSPDREMKAKAERQAINGQVQSTLSDLTQFSMALFAQKYGTPDGCRFFMMCHDALTAYVREDELDYWIPTVARLMSTLPLEETFGWKHQLQFTVDCEVGPNFAELKSHPLTLIA